MAIKIQRMHSILEKIVKADIDLSEYAADAKLASVYQSEYGWKRKGGLTAEICQSYLQGLPTVCCIPFENYTILKHLEKCGHPVDWDDEEKLGYIVDCYWQYAGKELLKLLKSPVAHYTAAQWEYQRDMEQVARKCPESNVTFSDCK